MGAALEWMGEDERRGIAESLLSDVDARGGRLWAACPFHVEQSKGGSFFYDPEKDHAFCFSCRASEDLVGVFCAVSGYAPNSSDGFRAFRDRYASGRELRRQERPAVAPRQPKVWAPRVEELPSALWSEKADAFIRKAVARLAETPAELARLEALGIDADTAAKCRIGWNDRDRYPLRTAWGLPYELNPQGKEKKLWLPEGLVLPFYVDGLAATIKIRRAHPEKGPEKFQKTKYYKIPGSCERLFVYGRPTCRAWVVVEAERDAAMIWGKLREFGVGAVGTGSASTRPDAVTAAILAEADMILVAFDNDNPGADQSVWWLEHFPLAVRWPVPPAAGKDPGDAIGPGLDVRAWVEAGLPSHVKLALAAACRRRSRPAPAVAAPVPAPAPIDPVEDYPVPVAIGEPFPYIPGLDFTDPELADLWNLLPADYPGKLAYFSLLGMFSLYPVRGVRVRKPGGSPERDGVALRMDAGWRKGNEAIASRASSLFWGEAWALWLDWNWRTALVEVDREKAA
jgi:hypothetical protein